GFWHNYSRCPLAADFDLDDGTRFGERGGDVAHAHANAERGALRAADDFADLGGIRSGAPNRIMGPRRGVFRVHLEGDALFGHAFRLLLREHGAANKVT